jgi:HK97 gp10 family phage protein
MDRIDIEIADINKKLNRLAQGLKEDLQENKAVKKKAARPVVNAMRTNAPKGPTGNLKRSIQILPLKSNDVFVGPKAKIAPHAHLVEYGFKHYRNGKKVEGKPFVKQSYDQTKAQVLEILKKGAEEIFKKWGAKL